VATPYTVLVVEKIDGVRRITKRTIAKRGCRSARGSKRRRGPSPLAWPEALCCNTHRRATTSRLLAELKQAKPFPRPGQEALVSILRTAAVLPHVVLQSPGAQQTAAHRERAGSVLPGTGAYAHG
jgi:hypothetical protein